MPVAEWIVCVECGGLCGLLMPIDPEAPPAAGDVVSYRCTDCADRWDVVVDEDDLEDDLDDGPGDGPGGDRGRAAG